MTHDSEGPGYSVRPYDHAGLRAVLAGRTGRRSEHLKKSHLNYLEGYCDYLDAKTILVEQRYVDRDYLEDYAGYYVRCFADYERFCERVHFFSTRFTLEEYQAYLAGQDSPVSADVLNAEYLGFVVLKPLPATFIGRTCLRTYPHDGRRYYPINRTYDVNLFGTRLTIESLAFQEQDTTVAACATSALWSAFQFTGKQFQHHIPSPLEITKAAAEKAPIITRAVPNRGLESSMMAQAIRHVGLEPYAAIADVDFTSTDSMMLGRFLGTIYAYLSGNIPFIFGAELIDLSGPGDPVERGLHAMTLAGFSLPEGPTPARSDEVPFKLRAAGIDRLYAHDDQVGPFSRLTVRDGSIQTAWLDNSGAIGGVYAVPQLLLAPLYHKIRIPYDGIEPKVMIFDSRIRAAFKLLNLPPLDLVWDIRLSTGSDYRTELLSGPPPITPREKLLSQPMPRFIWIASVSIDGTRIFDLRFDATDLEQGRLTLPVIAYQRNPTLHIRAVCEAYRGSTPREDAVILAEFSECEIPS